MSNEFENCIILIDQFVHRIQELINKEVNENKRKKLYEKVYKILEIKRTIISIQRRIEVDQLWNLIDMLMDHARKMTTFLPDVQCNLEYVKINSIAILVAQLGFNSTIFRSFDPINKTPKETCLIFIPGEVGNVNLYVNFLKSLYKKSNFPIIALSHAGHTILSDEAVYDPFEGKYKKNFNSHQNSSFLFNRHLFDVHGQIQSKLVFLQKFLPLNVRLFFIAHGIGCYITLQIFNSYPMLNVPQINMIAPSIENIHLTPFGRSYIQNFRPFKHYFIDKLIYLYRLLGLCYLNSIFVLIGLDRIVLYFYKKIFVKFFNQYHFVDSRIVPYLVLLLEDSITLIKDININLMNYLSARIKIIYFTNDHMNYAFYSLANRRRFSLNTFVISNCENLANQTKLLIERSNLNKKLMQTMLKEVKISSRLKLNVLHDFQNNSLLCRLLSTHIVIEILNKMNEPVERVEDEQNLSFESKEDQLNIKSISRILD